MWHFERLKWVPLYFPNVLREALWSSRAGGCQLSENRSYSLSRLIFLYFDSFFMQATCIYFLFATTRDEGVILDAGFYFSILYFFSSCTPWNVFLLPNKCFWFHNTCTGEVDLPSWQQVPDHLTDKFESNKNTPGLEKDQSQPDRIMWAETTY